jgi:hypothetical protein
MAIVLRRGRASNESSALGARGQLWVTRQWPRRGPAAVLRAAPESVADSVADFACGGRANIELASHLQAANLGNRSADLPIEQESEL